MSDPDALREPPPPPQPPRPRATNPQGSTPMSQLEADELYARQLAEHYDSRQYASRGSGQRERGRYQEPTSGSSQGDERNFFDDDLPVIKENLRKGFLETQTKVNGWITNLKKKIDGDDDAAESSQGFGPGSQNTRRSGDNSRRSGDYNRYDADPQVLGDDFASMQLNQDGMKSLTSPLLYSNTNKSTTSTTTNNPPPRKPRPLQTNPKRPKSRRPQSLLPKQRPRRHLPNIPETTHRSPSQAKQMATPIRRSTKPNCRQRPIQSRRQRR